jgi:hypothetical protein
MAKYKNKKIEVDGIKFDSKKEAKRYKELKALEQAGKIYSLRMQEKFTLIPAQYEIVNGKRKCVEREITYIADFTYYDDFDDLHVEDTKNPYLRKEPRYVMKRKMMRFFRGIKIEEV